VSVDAIVLAGGRARRFGSDKLAAHLDGTSLLSATIAAVAPIVDAVVIAGPTPREAFAPGSTPVTVVQDAEPFEGPLAALAGVLDHAVKGADVTDLAIVVGGDMPRLVPAVLKAMLDRLAADPTLDAVMLGVRGAPRRQVLPLALRIEPAARAARSVLEQGDRSLKGFVDRLTTLELPAAEWRALDPAADSLSDVDTPADLHRLRCRPSEQERER
jgi:molybdenum cofactor guanylyltransferase